MLSDATHYNGYDLAPTAAELRSWLDCVDQVIDGLAPSAAGVDPASGHSPTVGTVVVVTSDD